MKRLLFVIACVLVVGGWAWPWSTAADLSLPYSRDIRLVAVDGAHHPTLATVWKVTPATAGTVTLDQPQGWTVVFAPSRERRVCQVWSRTGALPWRKLSVRLVDPAVWFDTIAPGESWVHGSR